MRSRDSEPFEMTAKARADAEYALNTIPEQIVERPTSWSGYATLARGRHAFGFDNWEEPAHNAIVLLSEDILHFNDYPHLRIAQLYLWAGQTDRATKPLNELIEHSLDHRLRRPEFRNADLPLAYLLLGSTHEFQEEIERPEHSEARWLIAVADILVADRAGNRRERDRNAKRLLASTGFEPHGRDWWYRQLRSHMTIPSRLGRSSELPISQPSPASTPNDAL